MQYFMIVYLFPHKNIYQNYEEINSFCGTKIYSEYLPRFTIINYEYFSFILFLNKWFFHEDLGFNFFFVVFVLLTFDLSSFYGC